MLSIEKRSVSCGCNSCACRVVLVHISRFGKWYSPPQCRLDWHGQEFMLQPDRGSCHRPRSVKRCRASIALYTLQQLRNYGPGSDVAPIGTGVLMLGPEAPQRTGSSCICRRSRRWEDSYWPWAIECLAYSSSSVCSPVAQMTFTQCTRRTMSSASHS